jgi:hypothetical protein
MDCKNTIHTSLKDNLDEKVLTFSEIICGMIYHTKHVVSEEVLLKIKESKKEKGNENLCLVVLLEASFSAGKILAPCEKITSQGRTQKLKKGEGK